MYLLKLIKAQKVHFFYTLFLAGAAPAAPLSRAERSADRSQSKGGQTSVLRRHIQWRISAAHARPSKKQHI